MKFTSITTLTSVLLFAGFSLVSSLPVSLVARDVFVPPILYPTAGVDWIVGQQYTVVWNTTDHPVNITNSIGQIFLRKGGLTTNISLASNFSILLGEIPVTVPSVEDGNDYQIVLFGDSGNFSPEFTITHSY